MYFWLKVQGALSARGLRHPLSICPASTDYGIAAVQLSQNLSNYQRFDGRSECKSTSLKHQSLIKYAKMSPETSGVNQPYDSDMALSHSRQFYGWGQKYHNIFFSSSATVIWADNPGIKTIPILYWITRVGGCPLHQVVDGELIRLALLECKYHCIHTPYTSRLIDMIHQWWNGTGFVFPSWI